MRNVPERFRVEERGILSDEGFYVHTPSPFAREHLYYLTLASIYTCSDAYSVTRSGLDAYLFFYIDSGSLQFRYADLEFLAGPGDIVLLDCRPPHHYHALQTTRFHWFHFDGCASAAYYEQLTKNNCVHFPDHSAMEQYFGQIHNLMRSAFPDEGLLSVHIHRILALLASFRGPSGIRSDSVSAAKEYMDRHYREKISTDQLAALSAISASHFARIFREETGMTPYAYLTQIRLNQSMRLLLETSYSIEEIATYCSFCSAANYIRCFRQNTGTTPLKFRRLITGMTGNTAPL